MNTKMLESTLLSGQNSCESTLSTHPMSEKADDISVESKPRKEVDEVERCVEQSGKVYNDGTDSNLKNTMKEKEEVNEKDWLQQLNDEAKAELTKFVANGDHNGFVEYLQDYLGWIPSSPELHIVWTLIAQTIVSTSQVNKQSQLQLPHSITTNSENENENENNNVATTKTGPVTNNKWSDVKLLWKWTQARSWSWPSSWSWTWSPWSWPLPKLIPQGLDMHITASNVSTATVDKEEMENEKKSSYERKWYQRLSSRWRLGEKHILMTQQMPSNKTMVESWLTNSQVVTKRSIAYEKSQTYVTHLKPPANETLLFVVQNNHSHNWNTHH